MWQYMAVAGAGAGPRAGARAGAEIMDKVGAGALNRNTARGDFFCFNRGIELTARLCKREKRNPKRNC